MRINASEAASLIGRSDKFVRALCAARLIPGAEKVKKPGQAEQWEMELADFRAAAREYAEPRRRQIWQAWAELERAELLRPSPTIASSWSSSISSAPDPDLDDDRVTLPERSGTSPQRVRPIRPTGSSFRTLADARRWLERHGINVLTPRTWPGWSDVELAPEAVLGFALDLQHSGRRKPWQLEQCADDPLCVCHRML